MLTLTRGPARRAECAALAGNSSSVPHTGSPASPIVKDFDHQLYGTHC
jgi:hypothetical protein